MTISNSAASALIKAKHDLGITARMAHWTVRGADYYEAHLLFERIYEDLKEGTDELVEMLRVFGYEPSFDDFSGPGGKLESTNRKDLINILSEKCTDYYAALHAFKTSIEDERTTAGLLNLIDDLAQTCTIVMYLLSASKGN